MNRVLGSRGLSPTSVIQGNLPLYIGGLVFGKPFLVYHRSGFHFPLDMKKNTQGSRRRHNHEAPHEELPKGRPKGDRFLFFEAEGHERCRILVGGFGMGGALALKTAPGPVVRVWEIRPFLFPTIVDTFFFLGTLKIGGKISLGAVSRGTERCSAMFPHCTVFHGLGLVKASPTAREILLASGTNSGKMSRPRKINYEVSTMPPPVG